MGRLPEQQTFKPLEDTAFRMGKLLPPRQAPQIPRASQPTPVSSPVSAEPYSNLRGAIKGTVQPYDKFKDLGQITVPYRGSTRYEPGGTHMGVDIAAPRGTPIGSFTGGTVTDVVRGKGWTPGQSSFGNYVIITTPTGEKVRYSHLYEDFVKVGEQIQKGQKIGSIGGTGSTYSQHHEGPGYHLDLRIKDAANKYYINPTTFLKNYK